MHNPKITDDNFETYDYLMVVRGLSAVFVVFCHFPFELHKLLPASLFTDWVGRNLDWFFDPFGYIPVLVFFSLSGYLITLGFLSGRHTPFTFQGLKIYYSSRILRIIPLYYFSILLCIFLYWDLASQAPFRVLQLFIFTENYKPVQGIIFNHVYWTMPIEMLYFLLAPLIFLIQRYVISFFHDFGSLVLFTILFVCIAYTVFSALPTDNGAFIINRKSWSLIARFDFFYNIMAFALGGVCAFIVKNKNYVSFFMLKRNLIKITTFVLFILMIAYSSTVGLLQLNEGRLSYFIAFGLTPAVSLFILGIAILNETQKMQSTNIWFRGVVHLGTLSYGVYLFHIPILDTMKIFFEWLNVTISNEALSLISLALVILVSQLTYIYVEKPFLRRRPVSINLIPVSGTT